MGDHTPWAHVVLILSTALAVEVVHELLPQVLQLISAAFADETVREHVVLLLCVIGVIEFLRELLHRRRNR